MKQNIKQKLSFISTLTVSLAMALAMGAGSAAAQSVAATHGLREHTHLRNGTSTNWSGYAVETNLKTPANGAVTNVSGSWVVPAVTCPTRSTTSYSSSWVGVDGYSDNTVEQTGTEQDCNRGKAQYYAWYEFYPQSEILINTVPVHPGDIMSGSVTYASLNTFVVSVTDKTTGRTYSLSHRMTNALRQSAEWIEEAPSSFFGTLPLADFSNANFTNASATLNGHTGTINDTNWQNDPLTMVTTGGQPKDILLPLSTDGSGFGVSWLHN